MSPSSPRRCVAASLRPPDPDVARYGLPGSPIRGSALVRAYCCICGEPIRVPHGAKLDFQECNRCRGSLPRRVLRQSAPFQAFADHRPVSQ